MKKAILLLMSAILFPLCISAKTTTRDDGYFLSLKQKGQLIGRGRIQDAQGDWYDVYICPGYTHPILYGREQMQQAGDNFSEYVHKQKYSKIREHSGDAFDWAFKDCFHDYIWEGTGEAWSENFAAAKKRTEKRIFGWWLSYPWALMQSTVDNAIRVPLGLSGTAIGVVWGGAVVPVAGMTDSSVKGIWHAGTGGLALPAAGLAWNTMVSPPLALFGQKPAKERADGFWVRSVSGSIDRKPSEEDISDLVAWGKLLHRELAEHQKQRDAVQQEFDDRIEALNAERQIANKKMQAESQAIARREKSRVQELANSSVNPHIKWSSSDIQNNSGSIRRMLKKQNTLPEAEQEKLIRLLRQYPPASTESPGKGAAQKTDPVQESINIIKSIPDRP